MNIELFHNFFHSISGHVKISEAEWQRHSVTMGIPLPRLTASKNRKLAITVHREGGATREEQVALAKHMAHSVVTADKYYDKSDQREARHHCLDAIHHTIRVSKKLFDIIISKCIYQYGKVLNAYMSQKSLICSDHIGRSHKLTYKSVIATYKV